MVGIAALGSLVMKIKATGIGKATKGVQGFTKATGKMNSKIKPALKGMKKGWMAMGVAALGILYKLQQASPRLGAKFEILDMKVNKLLRSFGDALVPVIDLVIDAVTALTDWFKGLPQPLQDAVTFGTAVAVVAGLLVVVFGALSAAISPVTIALLLIALVAAALYLAWESNFLGIQQLTETVFNAVGVILDGVVNYIKAWVNMIAGFIDNFINIFKGIIDFIKAVFSGDLEGAIKAIQDIFKNAFELIAGYIMWPINALKALIDGMMGSQFLDDMLKAGQAFIDAFIEGIQKAIAAAGGIISDLLEWFGDWFGGSLPERGPLRHIVSWGQDLAKAYVGGVDTGLQSSNVSNVMNRNFNIANVEVNASGEDLDSTEAFGNRLDDDLRRAISW